MKKNPISNFKGLYLNDDDQARATWQYDYLGCERWYLVLRIERGRINFQGYTATPEETAGLVSDLERDNNVIVLGVSCSEWKANITRLDATETMQKLRITQ